jgi:hypothetical protein
MSYRNCSKHDDYTTRKETWQLLEKFIPKNKIIWESAYCDGESGRILNEMGYNVIHENKDYFNWEPENYDIQVTNPPFSIKKKWIKRAVELGKPFIFILPDYSLPSKYMKELSNDLQIIIPNNRIQFNKIVNGQKDNTLTSSSFPSYFFCYKMLFDKDLIFL